MILTTKMISNIIIIEAILMIYMFRNRKKKQENVRKVYLIIVQYVEVSILNSMSALE
jgi:hypothetical protein